MVGDDHKILLTLSRLGQVQIDPDQMEQVISNIVDNASDAMPNRGTIIIDTEMVTTETPIYNIIHEKLTPGTYILMTITDQGTGIPNDVLPKIFDPFYTTKEIGQGTGLGLSTAYGIIKQCKGFIHVETEKDKGSSFKIYLPAAS